MGAERSSEKTKAEAESPVAAHEIECGDFAGVYARGLETRGYEAKVLEGGKVSTTAPQSVFAAMDASYKATRAAAAPARRGRGTE